MQGTFRGLPSGGGWWAVGGGVTCGSWARVRGSECGSSGRRPGAAAASIGSGGSGRLARMPRRRRRGAADRPHASAGSPRPSADPLRPPPPNRALRRPARADDSDRSAFGRQRGPAHSRRTVCSRCTAACIPVGSETQSRASEFAAVLACGEGAVVGHRSAAWLWQRHPPPSGNEPRGHRPGRGTRWRRIRTLRPASRAGK